jgi:hypothetical protein
MSPFDFINAINATKNRDIIRSSETPSLTAKQYDAWLINRGFSLNIDCILFANEMNMRYQIPNQMQNDYYINSIRPGKRNAKWHKKAKDSAEMKAVMEYFSIGHIKAQEYLNVLTKEQIDLIKRKVIKGGISNELRSKSTDRGEVI